MLLRKRINKGQTALEYLLLFGVVMIIVVGSWNAFLARSAARTDFFFNVAAEGILGSEPKVKTMSKDYP